MDPRLFFERQRPNRYRTALRRAAIRIGAAGIVDVGFQTVCLPIRFVWLTRPLPKAQRRCTHPHVDIAPVLN